MKLVRSAYVIARRDFAATVFSKAFIFFLLGPLFPVLLGAFFGGIGARVATQAAQPVIAVVADKPEFQQLNGARDRVAGALGETSIVKLVRFDPKPDIEAQRRHLLTLSRPPVMAVLTDPFDGPRLVGAVHDKGTVQRQLHLMLSEARNLQPAGQPTIAVTNVSQSSGTLSKQRAITGQVGQMLVFFLTLLLAGMLLSQLIEEKSSKVIEVIAAAVPIDALFVGKLFAMLAASVVGIVLWTSAGALAIAGLTPAGLSALPTPAVGWPAYLILVTIYFGMNYLLLGAVFLSIGAQASTVREVQTMSMPVTFLQVIIFGFAALAVGDPSTPKAIAAAVFPLSSPLAMVARAAELPDLWSHALAMAWQILWIALTLRIGARLFRRSVLKSGPSRPWWKRATA